MEGSIIYDPDFCFGTIFRRIAFSFVEECVKFFLRHAFASVS
jgi:hypothetical protein